MRKAILGAIGAALLALGAASPAAAALQVFACEPEWAALSREIGGDKVSVYAATTGVQDPHQVQARPSLIAKARTADLTVCTGAELEIGWLPMIVTQSANKKIVAGAPGMIFLLADCWTIIGSQPISSSAPVQTVMSAERALEIRLGRAWIRCGSCTPVVAA